MGNATTELHFLELIGPLRLRSPGGEAIPISGKKSRALLALLALAPRGTRGRAWLQGMLWSTRFREQAQTSLRRELANLCSALDAHGAGHLVRRSATSVVLELDALDVDVLTLGLGPAGAGGAGGAGGVFLEDIALPDSPEFGDWLAAQRARVADLQRLHIPEARPAPGVLDILGAPLQPVGELLQAHPLHLPPKPSVCVLPFRTLGRPAGDLIGQGIAEELSMTLARLPSLFVASTPARLDADEPPATTIARRLGVAYVVGGIVMVDGGRVRVAVRLVAGATGHQVWAQAFDGEVEDIFAVQQRIARAVAPQIHTQIDLSELNGALVNPGRSGDAYALYWRANALFRQWTQPSLAEARDLCERLVAMQPTGGWAHAMAAFCHAVSFASGWTDDPAETRRTAVRHYQQALRFGGEDPVVLGYAAGTLVSIGGDLGVAERLVSHALTLLPSYQPTLFWGGWVALARGDPAVARERFELSLRINPEAGVRTYAVTGIGLACLLQGRFAEAYALLGEAVEIIPDYPLALVGFCVAAAMAGAGEEARRSAQRIREAGVFEAAVVILQKPEHRALLAAALGHAEGPAAQG